MCIGICAAGPSGGGCCCCCCCCCCGCGCCSLPSLAKSAASIFPIPFSFLDCGFDNDCPLSPPSELAPSVTDNCRASDDNLFLSSTPFPFPFVFAFSSAIPNLCGCHLAYFRFVSSPLTDGRDDHRLPRERLVAEDARREREFSVSEVCCCCCSGGMVLSMREMFVEPLSMVERG